jgi:2-dehydropantoate 2-reductase
VQERIAIVGSGAVGGYFGGFLTKAGHDVTLIDPWPEHVETMRREGITLSGMTPEEDMRVPVQAWHLTDVQGLSKQRPIDIAIIATKSYDTAWATTMIRPYLAPGAYVVSAQNSINEDTIAGVVGWGRTVGCIVGNNFSVELHAPGQIRRTMPRGEATNLYVGEVHGRVTPRAQRVAEILAAVDTCATTTNLWGVRWSKLCVNGMRNGVSAATGMGGNERDTHEIIRDVVIRLAGEAIRIGLASGYELEGITGMDPLLLLAAFEKDVAAREKVERHMAASSAGSNRSNLQRPSMAQDMMKGRRTEIDELNGLIVQRGEEIGCPAPTHRALVDIVKQVERGEIAARPEALFGI